MTCLVMDLWIAYVPLDAEQRTNRTFGLLSVRRPRIPGLIELAWPFLVFFTEHIFAEDRAIVEMEQAAHDRQGRDQNQEVFPPILDLRSLLARCGNRPDLTPTDRRTAVVTGATGGIGRWIALGLARAGFHVVLVGRDRTRGEAAAAWIGQQATGASTELLLADLASVAATRALADGIAARHPRLSLLVNNAGVFRARRELTLEGHDVVFAVNHLAPFVLTRHLEPALRAGAPSRVITIGSSTSDRAKINPTNFGLPRRWGMVRSVQPIEAGRDDGHLRVGPPRQGQRGRRERRPSRSGRTGLVRTPGSSAWHGG